MYIKKEDIGGIVYCKECPYFKLKTESIFSDNDLNGVVLTCENHDACFRINVKNLKENERRKNHESYEV